MDAKEASHLYRTERARHSSREKAHHDNLMAEAKEEFRRAMALDKEKKGRRNGKRRGMPRMVDSDEE